MNFKLINCGFFDSSVWFGNLKETKDRTVQTYEIEYFPVDGGMTFINGKGNRIENGSLLIAKPGNVRHSILPFKAFYVWISISDPDFISMVNNFNTFYATGKHGEKIAHYMNDIFDEARISKTENPLLECKIHSLIHEIYLLGNNNLSAENLGSSKYSDVVNEAIGFINDNYCSHISLKNISDYVHLSRIYFHDTFEKEVGITPHKYIMHKRIERAERLLKMSDMRIADISAECGFSTQSYFTDVFRKSVGITPKEYRKKCCESYVSVELMRSSEKK